VKRRRTKKNKAFPIYRGRRFLLMMLLLFGIVVLLARAMYLEIYKQDFLQAKSDKRQTTVVAIPSYRGMILDRNGDALAISSPVKTIVCNPQQLLHKRESLQQAFEKVRQGFELKGKMASALDRGHYERAKQEVMQFEDALGELAELLDLEVGALIGKLEKFRKRHFIYLGKNKSPELAQEILALELPTVEARQAYRRFYPMAESASHVIGFNNGLGEGIERAQETYLAGKSGKKRVVHNGRGKLIENIELLTEMKPGQDVTISLDRRLQYVAYKALKTRVFELDAETGAAVVLDTKTGEILAMASMPGFNPNDTSKLNAYHYRNRAVADMFEAGSTLKPLTIAAGIEARVIDADIKIDTSPGFIKLSKRYTVRDHTNYGKISLSYLLAKSSNVGASRIALLMSSREHWMFLSRLGFGRVTGAGFSVEAAGFLSNYAKWSAVDRASHGYGYGIAVTLLQLVRAYTPFATEGELRPVSITKLKNPSVSQRVMSKETATAVLHMMETVVAPNATGKLAAVAGYRVAGKTGTARKLVNKKYRTDRFVTSFVGIAPVSKPRLVVGVMINDPKSDKSGGKAAAPVFAQIMAAALRILDIAPDKLPAKPPVSSTAKGAAS
jgi:cell division protein FtsI (penicillin-binding protein 3)